jgi:hypothetical protein
MKADERIALTLQNLGMHGVLDFPLLLCAQFVVFDKRELASVNGEGYLRKIPVIEAASGKWCRYPMIVTRRGEQTCLPHVNLLGAVVGIDRSIGAHHPQRCRKKKPCHPEYEGRVAFPAAHYCAQAHFGN